MPLAASAADSAVAFMSPKPVRDFDADVVNTAGDHEVGFAELDLVHAFFQGHGCGCAGTDGVDHGSVAADERLHDVCGHHVGQGFLEDVAGSFFAEESGDEDLVQGFHATNTGALGGGDIGRVDDAEQFGGGEACAEERINGGDKVPHGDAVETFDHRCRGCPRFGGLKSVAADHQQRG